MIRVHVICEGQTEEMFVKTLLSASFHPLGIFLIPALIGRPGHKGGNVNFDRLRIDVRNRLYGDSTAFCTTFFDFYGLPTDFPGKAAAARQTSITTKAQCVQDSMVESLQTHIDSDAMNHFIPYVQMYEFEALLFSAPKRLAAGIYHLELADHFQRIRDSFESPEAINDNPQTAPSKRIKRVVADYEKAVSGSLAALEIGLATMRKECALFGAWLRQLEGLARGNSICE